MTDLRCDNSILFGVVDRNVLEVRCDNSILFGVVDRNVLEVKCRSSRCGAGKGVVVLHRFDIVTGQLLSTNRYKNPAMRRIDERPLNHHGPAVWPT